MNESDIKVDLFPQEEIIDHQGNRTRGKLSFNPKENMIEIHFVRGKSRSKFTVAHETQHLVQFILGELSYIGKPNESSSIPDRQTYDKIDEVEAYRIEQILGYQGYRNITIDLDWLNNRHPVYTKYRLLESPRSIYNYLWVGDEIQGLEGNVAPLLNLYEQRNKENNKSKRYYFYEK